MSLDLGELGAERREVRGRQRVGVAVPRREAAFFVASWKIWADFRFWPRFISLKNDHQLVYPVIVGR